MFMVDPNVTMGLSMFIRYHPQMMFIKNQSGSMMFNSPVVSPSPSKGPLSSKAAVRSISGFFGGSGGPKDHNYDQNNVFLCFDMA
jgi:hypothetical protein